MGRLSISSADVSGIFQSYHLYTFSDALFGKRRLRLEISAGSVYNYYDCYKVDALKSGDAGKILPVGASFTSYERFLLHDPWKSYRDNRRDAER